VSATMDRPGTRGIVGEIHCGGGVMETEGGEDEDADCCSSLMGLFVG